MTRWLRSYIGGSEGWISIRNPSTYNKSINLRALISIKLNEVDSIEDLHKVRKLKNCQVSFKYSLTNLTMIHIVLNEMSSSFESLRWWSWMEKYCQYLRGFFRNLLHEIQHLEVYNKKVGNEDWKWRGLQYNLMGI